MGPCSSLACLGGESAQVPQHKYTHPSPLKVAMPLSKQAAAAAAAAKSLQSCPTLCDPRDGSPPGSPGKNTGVGCHFLLQCMIVKHESEVAQLCPTLRDPMDRSPPGSSVHGIFQPRVLEWGAIAFSETGSTKSILNLQTFLRVQTSSNRVP